MSTGMPHSVAPNTYKTNAWTRLGFFWGESGRIIHLLLCFKGSTQRRGPGKWGRTGLLHIKNSHSHAKFVAWYLEGKSPTKHGCSLVTWEQLPGSLETSALSVVCSGHGCYPAPLLPLLPGHADCGQGWDCDVTLFPFSAGHLRCWWQELPLYFRTLSCGLCIYIITFRPCGQVKKKQTLASDRPYFSSKFHLYLSLGVLGQVTGPL